MKSISTTNPAITENMKRLIVEVRTSVINQKVTQSQLYSVSHALFLDTLNILGNIPS